MSVRPRRLLLTSLVLAGSALGVASGAERVMTILDLQPLRRAEQAGGATLTDLNPGVNRWFVLTINPADGDVRTFHLENPAPHTQQFHLTDTGLQVTSGATAFDCPLVADPSLLETAHRSGVAYAPLCDGRLYLRNRVAGRSSSLERVTDLLRDHVWGGDRLVNLVKREFFSDRFADPGVRGRPSDTTAETIGDQAPLSARLTAPSPTDGNMVPGQLGIVLDAPDSVLAPGRWYRAAGLPGVHAGFVEPRRVAPSGIERGSVLPLEPAEAGSLVYLVAFDLADFDLGYGLGTDHPRVGWSARPQNAERAALPGPDGIDHIAPLVTNGMVPPWLSGRTVATFAGGFKREHGAFRHGELARRNNGSHYGFLENGTIFSRLMPGLATLYVLNDGTVDMKTWTEADDALLPELVDARQNGVPLIEYDQARDASAPGALVSSWGDGNWSGSAEEKLPTVRAGACIQQTGGRRFLLYAYFSLATPSTMARVFQAYGCRYAMHLDMNALEHTYLAVYRHDADDRLEIEHLVEGMDVLDPRAHQRVLARFLEVPDDRDFFYVTRKQAP